MNEHTYVAIMAGGVGSRFWPASREARPKQFLDILGTGKSLLRHTFERFVQLVPADRIYIVTNARYQALVQEHLPEVSTAQILCEPSRNNTAPCVAYTAFKLHARDERANFVIAPSDAYIASEPLFLDNVRRGLAFTAEHDALLTLGIAPTLPHTGYGYVQFAQDHDHDGIYPVRRFTEKPDAATARQFLDSGDYLWNAGIFIWRASTILAAFRQYTPGIYELLSQGEACYNTSAEQAFIDRVYPQTESISVDYAIMEQATNVYTLPASFGWSDLGAWASLHQEKEADAAGNVVQGDRVLLHDVHNSLVRAPAHKVVAIGGLDDYIVVDDEDILLIYPKGREQEIKELRSRVGEAFGEEYL